MDVSAPTPRVNGSQLRQHMGQRVLLVGEVLNAGDGDMLRVMAADKAQVTVKAPGLSPPMTKYVEALCTVESDGIVIADQLFAFGDSFGASPAPPPPNVPDTDRISSLFSPCQRALSRLSFASWDDLDSFRRIVLTPLSHPDENVAVCFPPCASCPPFSSFISTAPETNVFSTLSPQRNSPCMSATCECVC